MSSRLGTSTSGLSVDNDTVAWRACGRELSRLAIHHPGVRMELDRILAIAAAMVVVADRTER
jgi:hypothetical protein